MASTPSSASQNGLVQGYRELREKANGLSADLLHRQSQQNKHGLPQLGISARIQTVINGDDASEFAYANPPSKPQFVARAIQAHSGTALEIIVADLEDNLHWLRGCKATQPYSDDSVRDELVKRMRTVEEALPANLKVYCELAFMHVEHENLSRIYANSETMYFEPVKGIAREDFYVTEDNYAWDMAELVQAITTNGGVMRNPLSKAMFTPKDIRGILLHPHGKSLAALQVAQHEMSMGVRPETIVRMEKLADVILADREQDQMQSRYEVDAFQAYIATLPEREKKTIDEFRCPAHDWHTGNEYDKTIGQAIREAKGNLMCFHKTGDFIKQAAAYLRDNRGVASEPREPEKGCTVI